MQHVVVGVFNPGESPADNGRMIHALKLAEGLIARGVEVEVVFEGQAVTWLPRFLDRDEQSHPFVRHYGSVFDRIRGRIKACNMCCKRFDVLERVQAAEIPILGEDKEHVDIAQYVVDGYQVINH